MDIQKNAELRVVRSKGLYLLQYKNSGSEWITYVASIDHKHLENLAASISGEIHESPKTYEAPRRNFSKQEKTNDWDND